MAYFLSIRLTQQASECNGLCAVSPPSTSVRRAQKRNHPTMSLALGCFQTLHVGDLSPKCMLVCVKGREMMGFKGMRVSPLWNELSESSWQTHLSPQLSLYLMWILCSSFIHFINFPPNKNSTRSVFYLKASGDCVNQFVCSSMNFIRLVGIKTIRPIFIIIIHWSSGRA